MVNAPRALLTLFLLLLLDFAANAGPQYRIIPLKPPMGDDASYATCLSDNGQVAGNLVSRKRISGGRRRGSCAFLWTSGRMRLLPSLPSPYSSAHEVYDAVASGVNDRGQVVGTLSYFFDGAWMGNDLRAVIWDGGDVRAIPGLRDMNQSTAIAINNAGQVAGTADDDYVTDSDGRPAPHLFLYTGGRSLDLGPGCATGLSADGLVCGYILLNASGQPTADNNNVDMTTQSQAVMSGKSRPRQLLGYGYALNINGSDNVIGTNEKAVTTVGPPQLRTQTTQILAESVKTYRKIFSHNHKVTNIIEDKTTNAARNAQITLWRTGPGQSRAAPLPIHWLPQAINNVGWVVGGHWLWERGQEYDLNRLIARNHGWKIVSANAINQRGQIAGWGMHWGQVQGFLLTPFP